MDCQRDRVSLGGIWFFKSSIFPLNCPLVEKDCVCIHYRCTVRIHADKTSVVERKKIYKNPCAGEHGKFLVTAIVIVTHHK